ncbi:hypothetical protein UY3_14439 [Chelonia mydas]|uniref:Zinc finger and SCAN domain-containing protein 29 n=1 Tax=Chelonia mydas TaxID=8469 RepID=M7BJS5_CHEMY|nr:hypothetical protein UY3_14439 [Chelonia mydas]
MPILTTLVSSLNSTALKSYKPDIHQCRVKIKELKQAYQKAREANHCSGAGPKTCRFYKELYVILGSDPTTKSPMDTSEGLEAAASGLNPDDEMVDEAVQLEDDVKHTTGLSSGLHPSGRLWSSLEWCLHVARYMTLLSQRHLSSFLLPVMVIGTVESCFASSPRFP